MFSRHVFLRPSALVATALLALSSPTVRAAAPDLCFGGAASGTWNLPPSLAQLGHAAGTLTYDESEVEYALFDAYLTEEPRRTPGVRSGRVVGFLTDPSDPENTFALVVGTWDFPGGITGSFSATIFDLGAGTFRGSMTGDFNLPIDGGTGNFLATWNVCTIP